LAFGIDDYTTKLSELIQLSREGALSIREKARDRALAMFGFQKFEEAFLEEISSFVY